MRIWRIIRPVQMAKDPAEPESRSRGGKTPEAIVEGESWPTPDQIHDGLRKGISIDLPDITPDEPGSVRRAREIPASWIAELVQQPRGIVERPIVIRNAIITGVLKLPYTEFQSDVRIKGCCFEGEVDLSFSGFSKAAILDRCIFEQDVRFYGMRADADFELTGTAFFGELDCQDLTVKRNLCAQGAKFRRCNFEGTSVGGQALFEDEESKPAHFQGEATFDLLQVGGGLYLKASQFESDATFTAAGVKCYADFSNVVFLGKAQFDGIVIAGDASFDHVRFTPDPTRLSDSRTPIRFPGIRVEGQAIFDHAIFGSNARFDQARFQAEVFFESAEFLGSVRFDGASFAGPTKFNHAAFSPGSKEVQVTFKGAKAAADVEFNGVRFLRGKISFQDADFKIVYFRNSVEERAPVDQPQFPTRADGELDMRGFSYERIFLAWREAIDIFEPYDVQPYRQMERAFRIMGRDRDGDRVYLSQRWRALRLKRPRRWINATGGALYWLIARFGVRPWRLAGISFFLVAFSIGIFHQPTAVMPLKDSTCIAHRLNMREALGVSLNYFLPVSVPVASCWAASGNNAFALFRQPVSFLLWGSLLKLMGWIFVPLGVAALSGLLRRDPGK